MTRITAPPMSAGGLTRNSVIMASRGVQFRHYGWICVCSKCRSFLRSTVHNEGPVQVRDSWIAPVGGGSTRIATPHTSLFSRTSWRRRRVVDAKKEKKRGNENSGQTRTTWRAGHGTWWSAQAGSSTVEQRGHEAVMAFGGARFEKPPDCQTRQGHAASSECDDSGDNV